MQKRFNQYYLTELIGSQPLRSAYLAHHIDDASRTVLLKIFDSTCLALGLESERFLYQVEWIKQLRHEHILPILDLGVEQGQPYIVSEYLTGGTLRHRLDNLFPEHLSLQDALRITWQVGQALSYFHERAHLHGNIKPENIFFNEQNDILLADFRLTGFIDVSILNYQSEPRTICYMAPEQFIGLASEKSDQYALACLAYELIAGRMPFSAQGYAMMWANHYAESPPPLSDFIPDLPESIEKAVFKGMSKDPFERHIDIHTFLLALGISVPSPAPAVAEAASATSVFNSTSAEVAESLDGVNAPVDTGLTGIPVEGSLASAPFGTGLAGVPLGASLAGVSFGASLAGVPFGTSLTGNPFERGLTGEALSTSLEQAPVEEDVEGNPFERGLTGEFRATRLGQAPIEEGVEGNPFERGLTGEFLAGRLEEDSLDMGLEGNPFEAGLEEDLFGTGLEGNPFEMSLVDTPLTTHLLERWERASSNRSDTNIAATTRTPEVEAYAGLSWVRDFLQYCKYSVPALWFVRLYKGFASGVWLEQLRSYLGNLLTTIWVVSRKSITQLSQQPLVRHFREEWEQISSEFRVKREETTDTPEEEIDTDATLHSREQFLGKQAKSQQDEYAHMEVLSLNAAWLDLRHSVRHFFEECGDSISALWLRFRQGDKPSISIARLMVIIFVIILTVGVVSWAFLASHQSNAAKPVQVNMSHQMIVNPRSIPIDPGLVTQPVGHSTAMPIP